MKLEAYSDATVVLTLPNSVMMADIVWFSVWCRQAAVSTDVLIKLAYIQICTIILIATLPLEMDIIKFYLALGSPANFYCTNSYIYFACYAVYTYIKLLRAYMTHDSIP